MTLRIGQPGLLTTVQDRGRHGHQRDGVPPSGAMDEFALRLANILVGNDEGDAGLEITLVGPTLSFDEPALIALAGANLDAVVGNAIAVPPWHPVTVPRGATLSFRRPASGCRTYLAVAGGIAVPPVLGSRSTYVRGSLGGHEGRALARGDALPLGSPSLLAGRIAANLTARDGGPVVGRWGVGPTLRATYTDTPVVRLLLGAHTDALTTDARERLYRDTFRVSPRSDRMGYRLEGEALELSAPLELLSEAVTFGTVQLPPDGHPIVLMADRQTTGGYPRIGEVATVDLPLLAQLKPGDRVRFTPVSLDDAQALYLAREREVAQARRAIALRHPREIQ